MPNQRNIQQHKKWRLNPYVYIRIHLDSYKCAQRSCQRLRRKCGVRTRQPTNDCFACAIFLENGDYKTSSHICCVSCHMATHTKKHTLYSQSNSSIYRTTLHLRISLRGAAALPSPFYYIFRTLGFLFNPFVALSAIVSNAHRARNGPLCCTVFQTRVIHQDDK